MNSLVSANGPSVTWGFLSLLRMTVDWLGSASAWVLSISPDSVALSMNAWWPATIACCSSSDSDSITDGSTCINTRYFMTCSPLRPLATTGCRGHPLVVAASRFSTVLCDHQVECDHDVEPHRP